MPVVAASLLGACGTVDSMRNRVVSDDLRVQEIARSQQCASPDPQPRLTVFADLAAFEAWQAARGIALLDARQWQEAPHVLVELGAKPTGGHGLAVSRAARLRGDGALTLSAMVSEPVASTAAIPAPTAPCALVRLPRGAYASMELRDQTGRVRARTDLAPATPDATPGPATEPPADASSSWWPF